MDAAHFVHSAFLGFLWCFTRVFVKAPSGRQRFNVLAALDAIGHEILTITNQSYINAQSVCQLLRLLAQRRVGVPITLVLDDARYQRCALVEACALSLGIELLFLPPYSPNLNLIERFWKFVKKECLYSRYYDSLAAFTQALTNCIETAHQKHQEQLATLLPLKFQVLESENCDR